MNPNMVVAMVVGLSLVMWYGALALSLRKRKAGGARRTHRAWSGASSTDAATQAAIDTAVICSSIDAGHHG